MSRKIKIMCFMLQVTLAKMFFPKYWFVSSKAITALAAHESNYFSSPVYKRNKNAFGMRFPTLKKKSTGKVRKTTALRNGAGEDAKGQAVYGSVFMSIVDIFHWMNDWKTSPQGDIITNISKTWSATDGQHQNTWRKVNTQISVLYGYVPITVLGLATILIIWLIRKIN